MIFKGFDIVHVYESHKVHSYKIKTLLIIYNMVLGRVVIIGNEYFFAIREFICDFDCIL